MFKFLFIFCFYIFLTELIIGGPGFWGVNEFGISIRKILFFLTLVTGYIQLFEISSISIYLRDKLIFIFISISFLVWMLILPLINGQSLNFAFQDGSSIFIFLLYFPIVQLLRKNALNWINIEKYFVNLCTLVAVFQIIIWFNYEFFQLFNINMLDFFSVTEYGSIYVGPMPDGFYRVMWITTAFMIPAIFVVASKHKYCVLDYLKIVCFIVALYVSYTRALWIATILGVIIIIMFKDNVKARDLIIVAIITCLVLGSVILTNTDSIFVRLSSIINDSGAYERVIQINSILEKWGEHFLFGTGFGGYANYIRVDAAPYSYEVALIALLMKLGIVGTFLWFICLVYIFYITKPKSMNLKFKKKWRYMLAATVGFLFSTATNPYLFNFVGMTILLFVLVELEKLHLDTKN